MFQIWNCNENLPNFWFWLILKHCKRMQIVKISKLEKSVYSRYQRRRYSVPFIHSENEPSRVIRNRGCRLGLTGLTGVIWGGRMLRGLEELGCCCEAQDLSRTWAPLMQISGSSGWGSEDGSKKSSFSRTSLASSQSVLYLTSYVFGVQIEIIIGSLELDFHFKFEIHIVTSGASRGKRTSLARVQS